ncbi:MAG: S41 family peptidase [Rikenellaceae bacterium]|nr:S41 family peptidase [Rikenellaceae bacterium]
MEYRNSKRHIWLPLIVAVTLVCGIFLGRTLPRRGVPGAVPSGLSFGMSPEMANDKLNQVLSRIYNHYVDEPQMDSIQEQVIPMILESLDPHSAYIPAENFAQVFEPLEGQFDGIGVTFNMMTDTVRVINVILGGPSAKAGIQNGDRIITIGDSLVAGKGINQEDIVKMLRGPRGTLVNLDIERIGLSELLPVTVERGIIPMKSVDAGFMVTPETGYIKLSLFSRHSHTEIVRIVEEMQARGMKNLILDLRGNSGGLLDQAIYIANEFLPKDALIVYTEGRASRRREQRANGKGRLLDIEPVILIDEGSASASEIVAGALQDNDRGTIIGRRSFGKGLVQEQMEFGDGSAMRLSIARYYTPVGRSIQKPYDEGNEAYHQDILNRIEHSELFTADSIRFADSLAFTTPAGKVVYGGGGIMPDIFVPVDTLADNRYAVQVINRNILFRYTMAYADQHRLELNAIATLTELDAYFGRDEALLADFVRNASSQGVSLRAGDLEASRNLLIAYLKAYIGRNTPLEGNAFYYYLLPIDNTYIRTEEYLREKAGQRIEMGQAEE